MTLDLIHHQDCLIGMRDIPDGSIDCIITDLPYQVLHKNNKNVQWDRLIPFEPMWEQFERIIRPDGAIVLFGQGMFTAQLMMSNPKLWRYNLIWDKQRVTGFLNANRQPMRVHEDIMVFSKRPTQYHPQFEQGTPNHSRGNGKHKQTNQCYGKHGEVPQVSMSIPVSTDSSDFGGPASENETSIRRKTGSTYDYAHIRVVPPTTKRNEYGNEHVGNIYDPVMRSASTAPTDLKFPRSIVRVPKEHGSDVWHPTQKPVALIRWLIRTYTDPGMTILDACMGSGSTAIAAIAEGRHYIGFETDPTYYAKANQRIADYLNRQRSDKAQLVLDL